MNDAILERLNRLERESRFWRYACIALLMGVIAAAVKAQSPANWEADGYKPMAGSGEKNGEFDVIHAERVVAESVIVKGELFVVKKGGNASADGDHISMYMDPNPTIMLQKGDGGVALTVTPAATVKVIKGQSEVSMAATDAGGEMHATDSGGQSTMQFPTPKH
jgi:hypothetical protein